MSAVVESYRGIIIYQDRQPGGRSPFRCTVNGKQIRTETLAAIKAEIDLVRR